MAGQKRTLVIGARGLVGSCLVRELGPEACQGLGREDIGRFPELLRESFDRVVFLAQSPTYQNPGFAAELLAVNVELLRSVLHQAAGKIPHAVVFSTGSVYQRSSTPLFEDSPLDWGTASAYAASKLCAELVAQTFAQDFSSLSIIRPFFIYGREQKDGMLFKRLSRKIATGETIRLQGRDGMLLNPVHVSDVCSFLASLGEASPAGLGHFNVFGPETASLRMILELMSRLLSAPLRLEADDQPEMCMVAGTRHSIFHPAATLAEGLAEMLSVNQSEPERP